MSDNDLQGSGLVGFILAWGGVKTPPGVPGVCGGNYIHPDIYRVGRSTCWQNVRGNKTFLSYRLVSGIQKYGNIQVDL